MDDTQDNQANASLQKEYNSLKRKIARLEREYDNLMHLYKQTAALRDYNEKEKERQMLYNQMLRDNSPDDIFLVDTNLNVLLCTSSVKKRFAGDVEGKPFLPLVDMLFGTDFARRFEIILNEVSATGENCAIDIQSNSGSDEELELFFSCRISPALDDEGHVTGIVVLAHDNTGMHNANMRAEAATRAKTNFLANMSHEMRTPLNAVIGLSELILDSGGMNKESGDRLEKIHTSGMTLLSIVNDILDLSKIESGKFEINPVEYYTSSLINDVVTLNVMRGEGKPIEFKISIDERLPVMLYGDDLRVKQIFNNLLSNAFKYTNSGTVEWNVSFEEDGGNFWLVSGVKDSGIGIKPEDMQKLFQEYNQVDTKTNRKVEGTGLGLAITKRLVDIMDGKITVESEYGKGSNFNVRVFQKVVSDTPIGAKEAANLTDFRHTVSKRIWHEKIARVNLSYARVLIVDDVETNLEVAKGMIKPYGAKTDCALSGTQAIEMIRAGSPRYNAVFMDHMMPGMDGVEATKIIREEIGTDYARNVPIIALTANAIIGSEEMFLNKGFQAFISKPIDMVKLDSVLNQWVRDRELEKKLPAVTPESGGEPEPKSADKRLFGDMTIGGLDIDKCLKSFNDSEDILIQVLRTYAEKTRPLIDRMRELLAASNLKDYAITVHGIKGSSYSIFALETGKAAEELEFAAKAGDTETVKSKHAPFEERAETLLDNIDAALAAIDAVTKKYAAAPDPSLLEELRIACGDYDMNGVDKAMTQLESFKYESGGEIVEWLREKINDLSFEEIALGNWPQE